MTRRVLVAAVGNIFLGDDGFGVEVARRIAGRRMPDGVEIVDFGIRGVHLAYQLLDGYDQLILIDAAPRGQAPGTVSLLEVDMAAIAGPAVEVERGGSALVDAHGLEPGAILSMLSSLGGYVESVLVVACEPATVAERIGLSPPVEAAIPRAIELLVRVLDDQSSTAKEVSR